MPELHVIVASPEEAVDGIAEFWSDGRMVAETVIHEEALHLRIDPRADRAPVMLEVRSLLRGLEEAQRKLASY